VSGRKSVRISFPTDPTRSPRFGRAPAGETGRWSAALAAAKRAEELLADLESLRGQPTCATLVTVSTYGRFNFSIMQPT
jgi:hypothetical protein